MQLIGLMVKNYRTAPVFNIFPKSLCRPLNNNENWWNGRFCPERERRVFFFFNSTPISNLVKTVLFSHLGLKRSNISHLFCSFFLQTLPSLHLPAQFTAWNKQIYVLGECMRNWSPQLQTNMFDSKDQRTDGAFDNAPVRGTFGRVQDTSEGIAHTCIRIRFEGQFREWASTRAWEPRLTSGSWNAVIG